MKTIGNIIWLVFGGVFIAIEYLISSVALMVTIIGIPFGFQTLKLAGLALWPFGSEIRTVAPAPGCLSTLMNVIWFFVGGLWICLTHLAFGVLFAITIIGLPFAMQHFKLAGLALTPFGREVVSKG
ncbi:MAG: YccF domain-containing protein [Reichenbachiella sp.]